MGRHKKQLTDGSNAAIIVRESVEIAELPYFQISEREREMLEKNASQITMISSRLATTERKIERITEDLRKDKLRQELSELKKQRKTFLQLHRDASNKYNGALEFALRDIEGANLDEKIDRVRSLNS